MLALFLFRRISNEVLSPDVYTKIPDAGILREKAINAVESAIGKMVGPAVAAAWGAVSKAVDEIAKPTEEKIRQAVGPLFEAIKKMKEKVQAKFEEKVNPIISKLSEPIMSKLLPKLYRPLTECFKKLISEFCEHKDNPRGSWHLYWEIRDKLDDFDELMQIAREITDVEELGEFTTKVNDACTKLLEQANYTHNTHKDKKRERPFERTCDELLHDMMMDINGIAEWLLDALVLKPFNDAFGAVVDELCGPLEELIPDPVKEFLSPSDTIKEMGNNAVASALKAILASGGDQSGPLIAKFADKGVQGVKLIEGPAREEEGKKEGGGGEAPKAETKPAGEETKPAGQAYAAEEKPAETAPAAA